jgi:filamentous hemagglutinin family protein
VNDGSVQPDGYIIAADVTLRAADKIWVQNSGGANSPEERAGITVGPNTLTIISDNPVQPTELIINAREEDGSGGFVTGRSMLGEVVLSQANLADGSTINSCDVSTGVCSADAPPPPPVITGFLGTPNIVAGGVSVSDDHSFINISSSRAIINWTDAQTDFLPSANFAEFRGLRGDYVVLNRVLATDQSQAIQLNGRIDSFVNGIAGRGKIWFYSPSGILVGSGARINVGSLLLSASNILDTDFLDGDNSFSLTRSDSLAAVEIAPGAQVSARDPNAYLALLAPRVRQSGAVEVNGGAAYIALRGANLTISGAMFDIQSTGATAVFGTTEDTAALVHDGSTMLVNTDVEGGYGPAVVNERQTVLLTAGEAGNSEPTILVSGQFGYEPSSDATDNGSRIVIAGDLRVTNGVPSRTSPRGNVVIGNGTPTEGVAQTVFGSDLLVSAGTVTVNAVNTATIDPDLGIRRADIIFAGDARLLGSISRLEAGDAIVQVGGNLEINANRSQGGLAALVAGAGSLIRVEGVTSVLSNAISSGAANSTGSAIIQADGGELQLLGDTFVRADARAGDGTAGSGATGGLATVGTSGDGRIVIAGNLAVSANATGNSSFSGVGGFGQGGTAAVVQAGIGAISVDGNSEIRADGQGGLGGQGGGRGQGGSALIRNDAGTLALSGRTDVTATGTGEIGYGGAANGGLGQGGRAAIQALGGTVTLSNTARIDASASGGERSGSGALGNATGGTAEILVSGELATRRLELRSQASTGFSTSATSALATGGTSSIDVDGGTLDIGYGLSIDSSAFASSGSAARGGSAIVTGTGGIFNVADGLDIAAIADAGSASGRAGGAAIGGTAALRTAGTAVTIDGFFAELSAQALAGTAPKAAMAAAAWPSSARSAALFPCRAGLRSTPPVSAAAVQRDRARLGRHRHGRQLDRDADRRGA